MKSIFLIFTFFTAVMAFAQDDTGLGDTASTDSSTFVRIITDYGDITLKLYNETPLHKENFLKLVSEGFYDSLLFHRVINNFMIQGGSPDSKTAPKGAVVGMGGGGSLGYYVPNEFNEKIPHKKGVLAAARDNNPQKASNSSQFYIVQGQRLTEEQLKSMELQAGEDLPWEHREIYKQVGGTPHLYFMEFTVFGEVVDGMDFVEQIAAAPTDKNARPLKDIRMRIEVVEGE